jgi:hypothetical protein
MSNDVTRSMPLRQFYGDVRGHAEGWEREFDRLTTPALDGWRRRFGAECAELRKLDAEIEAAWSSYDPEDIRTTAPLDELLERRDKHPARRAVVNRAVVAIVTERKRRIETERRRARQEAAERDYAPPVRPGLRVHYDGFAPMFRRD